MADFTLPSLGADMEEGTLVEWLVKPGDQVKSGDPVVVIETTKGAIETEIFENGRVGELRVKVGERVPVGTVLATIVSSEPVASQTSSGVRASPAARKRAAELGLVLADIRGTGPGDAITLPDVEAGEKQALPTTEAVTGTATEPAPQQSTRLKRGFDPELMRQAIATAMTKSKRDIPHYYLSTQIDMQRAQQWLTEENATRKAADRLLQVVLPLKAMALALRKVPELNGFYKEGVFEQFEGIHIGVAIALRGGGLVAPALHDVDRKTLDQLMHDLNDLILRARTGMLRSSEMSDPTITLTNMGDTGVEQIFGVIYPPQVAILGLGKVVERPWAVEGKVELRPIITASLSADHRVSDGHRGAIFLNTLNKLLQTPEAL